MGVCGGGGGGQVVWGEEKISKTTVINNGLTP